MNRASSESRVVVTGLGLVSPVGAGREESWRAVRSASSAVQKGGARAPLREGKEPRAAQLALAAAAEALADAGVRGPLGERTGSAVSGSKPLLGAGGALPAETVAHAVSRAFGVEGPVVNFSAACATGLQSVLAAAGWIREGRCDAALAGAAESSFHPLYMAGFDQMGVLSPSGRVRPFDKARDGFVMGEGAGVFYLETLESARRRGARVYGELLGGRFGCDAHHATRFNSGGRRMADTLAGALKAAGLSAADLDYVNAHGTATPLNDALEARALAGLGLRAPVSSTKGSTGHMLGATGAVELGFTFLALRDGVLPPTLNLEDPETTALDFVPGAARPATVRRAASLSFGFGGSLAAAVVGLP